MLYEFKCPQCFNVYTEIYKVSDRDTPTPCPKCRSLGKRIISVSTADCFSERPAWIGSVGDVVDPTTSPAAHEFFRNRTRENYRKFMEATGLRHVESGEKLGKNTKPIDMDRANKRICENLRKRKTIHL
jgi:putative FmdB family regulatory protein